MSKIFCLIKKYHCDICELYILVLVYTCNQYNYYICKYNYAGPNTGNLN